MSTVNIQLDIKKASKEHTSIFSKEVEFSQQPFSLHSNYFVIVWIHQGSGTAETDLMKTDFSANQILCFNTYQAFVLYAETNVKASLLFFHANFFCIETYHHEVGCNGVLFNNVYATSKIEILKERFSELSEIFNHIKAEIKEEKIASNELVFSYLKIFLIKLTRLKSDPDLKISNNIKRIPAYLEPLSDLINQNFHKEHQPAFYADKLNITVKTLSKTTRQFYNKTVTALLHEKIILKAKWELLHTNIPIKQIASELGFNDEYYFSRFFKKHIGLSPKQFREEEWNIRRGFLSIP